MTRSEIRTALHARGPAQEELFAEARRRRDAAFGGTVLVRGVVETTNVCRVDCDYCPMRKGNAAHNDRYQLTVDEIAERARSVRDAGIDILLLQGGETARNAGVVEKALPVLREIFDHRVELLLNLGVMDRDRYRRLRELGATSYILKHETSDPHLHQLIRHEPLDQRLQAITDLLDLGYRVGTGLISDLPGQSLSSMIDDIELAGRLGVHMCSVSPFMPAPDTPLAGGRPGSLDLALNIVACLRIAQPTLLIPSVSAFEQAADGGQARGLAAGANVMTVNFSAETDRGRYLIYGKDRYVVRLEHVRRLVEAAGLRIGGSVFLAEAPKPDAVAEPRGGRR